MDLTYSEGVLCLLFGLVAFFYSMAGFGGGSTYLALLVLWKFPLEWVPLMGLSCNVLVVGLNCFRFVKNKTIPWKKIFPFVSVSLFFSYLGGRMRLAPETYQLLLGSLLLFSALKMFMGPNFKSKDTAKNIPLWGATSLGGGVGLLAGMTGIGGGIFLAPLLHWTHFGNALSIASCSSLFILVNSLAGLVGQWQKLGKFPPLAVYWPFVFSVLVGGFYGGKMLQKKLNKRRLEVLTAFLLAFVSVRLLLNAYSL